MLSPKLLNGAPVSIHLHVADVDAVVDCAKVTMPVADTF
jgi:hypothetical protein